MGAMGIVLAFAGQISAQTNGNERQTSDNLRRLQDHISTFRYDLTDALRTVRSRQAVEIVESLERMETSYRSFNDDFRAKRETDDGLRNLLNDAKEIDVSLRSFELGDKVTYDWSRVRTALEQLAAAYKISWSWDEDNFSYSQPLPSQSPTQQQSQQQYPQTSGNFNTGLSGVYRLNTAESENSREVAERAVLIINARDRDRVRADLEDKLSAPDELTLDIRGQQVTITSSKGAQATFTADGTDKYETGRDGRTTSRTRATLRGERLTISDVSDRDNNYTVTFESTGGGRQLRVTRRVTYESISQTVLAESVYDKTSNTGNTGDVGNYPNNPNQYPGTGTPRSGDFIVPNGTVLSAILETEISTKVSQNNDRFRMTVQAPNEYRGAVIEGYLSGVKRSGKLNSRAQITLNFERIRMKNGATYEFAGVLQSMTNANGEIVKIDTEGVAKGESQTKETVKRGGIGAGIGAIIGGVIGGVKGAVIGATIGAAGGAGSVYVQGRDDLELKPGTTVGIQATAPSNRQ